MSGRGEYGALGSDRGYLPLASRLWDAAVDHDGRRSWRLVKVSELQSGDVGHERFAAMSL